MAQTVKHLSTMQETWVRSLGWEDPLEKEIAIHSRTTAWKIPLTEEPGTGHGVAKSRTRLSDFTSLHFTSLGSPAACRHKPHLTGSSLLEIKVYFFLLSIFLTLSSEIVQNPGWENRPLFILSLQTPNLRAI